MIRENYNEDRRRGWGGLSLCCSDKQPVCGEGRKLNTSGFQQKCTCPAARWFGRKLRAACISKKSDLFFCQQTGNHGQDTHLKYHIHLCTNAGNKIIELPRRLVEPTWGQWKEIKYTDAQMFGVTTNSLFSFKNNKNTQSIIGVLNDSRWLRPIKQSKTIAPLVQWHTELLNGSFHWC